MGITWVYHLGRESAKWPSVIHPRGRLLTYTHILRGVPPGQYII